MKLRASLFVPNLRTLALAGAAGLCIGAAALITKAVQDGGLGEAQPAAVIFNLFFATSAKAVGMEAAEPMDRFTARLIPAGPDRALTFGLDRTADWPSQAGYSVKDLIHRETYLVMQQYYKKSEESPTGYVAYGSPVYNTVETPDAPRWSCTGSDPLTAFADYGPANPNTSIDAVNILGLYKLENDLPVGAALASIPVNVPHLLAVNMSIVDSIEGGTSSSLAVFNLSDLVVDVLPADSPVNWNPENGTLTATAPGQYTITVASETTGKKSDPIVINAVAE